MKSNYSESELVHMSDLISDYISKEECEYDLNCKNCNFIDDCYIKANNRCNSEFAESINYGGYSTEEEFWEQLFD